MPSSGRKNRKINNYKLIQTKGQHLDGGTGEELIGILLKYVTYKVRYDLVTVSLGL